MSNSQPAKASKCNNAPKKTTTVKGFIASLTASNATNIVGHPKGSTDSFNRDMVEKMEQATQEAIQKLKKGKAKEKHKTQVTERLTSRNHKCSQGNILSP